MIRSSVPRERQGWRADYVDIREDDVSMGHEATVSKISDDQLFYLMSRGISVEDARRLVVRGFFSEIISEIADEEVQDRLMARIDGELIKVGA